MQSFNSDQLRRQLDENNAAMNMTDQKTLPCPFCSSAAEVKSAVVDGKEHSNVSCSKTACPGFNNISHQRTTKISVKLWNTRHD